MNTQKIYDIIGVGIGPFNLGLAAIVQDLPELKTLFLDQRPNFDWHPGLMLPTSRMQVPYYADLVTIVNPKSDFTFHRFLQQQGLFFRFANQENSFPLRVEYNRYCQWVAAQLQNLRFNQTCRSITFDAASQVYTVNTDGVTCQAKHIVLGTGTVPCLPICLQQINSDTVIHASEYLFHKSDLLKKKKITIIGSGQSAAEIFQDLLPHADNLEQLSWFTRSSRFHPMDFSRFTTEMTSMDYIDYFYDLSDDVKASVLDEQQYLYKGINQSLIAEINDALYVRSINGARDNVTIHTSCALQDACIVKEGIRLTLQHKEMAQLFTNDTDMVIAATGYQYQVPNCLEPIRSQIEWNRNGSYAIQRNYSIDRYNSLFVQNADLHTHGFNSADLGMGPYRNATILNAILKRDVFTMERETAFQTFGLPAR